MNESSTATKLSDISFWPIFGSPGIRKDFIQEKIRLHKEEEAIGVGCWLMAANYRKLSRNTRWHQKNNMCVMNHTYIIILTMVCQSLVSLHFCKHCFINHIYKIHGKHQRCQPSFLSDRGRKRPSSSNCMRQGPLEGFCWIAGCDFIDSSRLRD